MYFSNACLVEAPPSIVFQSPLLHYPQASLWQRSFSGQATSSFICCIYCTHTHSITTLILPHGAVQSLFLCLFGAKLFFQMDAVKRFACWDIVQTSAPHRWV